MMTSLAFILGVVPLMVSAGAGAEMRQTLGTAVFSGMLGVTLFGIFLTPVFYYVIQWFSDQRAAARQAEKLGEESDDDQGGGDASETAAVLADGDHAQPDGNGVVHAATSCRALTVRATCVNRGPPMRVPLLAQAERGLGRARDRAQHRIDRPDLRGRRRDALAGAAAGLPSRRPPSAPRGPGLLGASDLAGRRPPGRGRGGARPRRLWSFSTKASRIYTDARYRPGDTLIFGPESRGLPEHWLANRRSACSANPDPRPRPAA